MRNRTYGGVRGRKTKVGEKLLRFPPTRLPNATILRPIRHPISFELVVSFFIKFVVIGSYCFSMVFRGGSRGRTCRPCRLVASKLAYSYKVKIFLYKGQIFSTLFASHAESFFAHPYRGIGMKGSASTPPLHRFRCAMLTSGLRSYKMPCRAARGRIHCCATGHGL